MGKLISMQTRNELVKVLGMRYREGSIEEKGRILDEFTKVSGYHRKHAIRLLGTEKGEKVLPPSRRIYDEAVKEALTVIWEASDRICSKRLKPLIPTMIQALEAHKYFKLNDEVREKLLSVSPATIDRLLGSIRSTAAASRRRTRLTKLKRKVPVKTSSDWDGTVPGFFQGDFVVHAGGSLSGHPIHTFTITDVSSGWTDFMPLLAREQSLVAEALTVFREQLPMPMLGFSTDNDRAFINETLIEYCADNGLVFSRARPRRSNDQAWIEQKNGAIIRKLAGYDRYEGITAGRLLCKLYSSARLFTNYFQPSFQLQHKFRDGTKIRKIYDKPATPCDRLLSNPGISKTVKKKLLKQRKSLDPILLLKNMRDAQKDLAILSERSSNSDSQTIDDFIRELPTLWNLGEVRPTSRRRPFVKHNWRNREDPFEEVMPQILKWLEAEPDHNAKELFIRLQEEHPDQFRDGQLRTLQRRVKAWRNEKARALLQLYSYEEANSEEATTIIAR